LRAIQFTYLLFTGLGKLTAIPRLLVGFKWEEKKGEKGEKDEGKEENGTVERGVAPKFITDTKEWCVSITAIQ